MQRFAANCIRSVGSAAMQGCQTSYLGLRDMPGDISEFELQIFCSFSRAELELIAAAQR